MKTIGLTMGDPAGIGPEIVLRAAAHPWIGRHCRLFIYGDKNHLTATWKKTLKGRPRYRKAFVSHEIVDFGNVRGNLRMGTVSRQAGRAAGEYLEAAAQDAMTGKISALVTAPINKKSFTWAGWGKVGLDHTTFLAKISKTPKVRLMLAAGSLRSVQVTSHIALQKVPRFITTKNVFDTIVLSHDALRKMGYARPKLVVCGLNPHAGDLGVMGSEEKRAILPAILKARARKIKVDGPFSGDTVWPRVASGTYHAGIAMYHDQGQIPVKMASFKNGVGGVNITLGLPFIRTSVAHGTAFDIAGRGRASEDSLVEAIKVALNLAR